MAAGLTIKRGMRAAFHKAGGLHLARWVNRKGLRILMYHRFSDPAGLESQCRHIRQHYVPVSLAQVDAWLTSGNPLPVNAIAVTVDDGYRDFREVAYPVFAAWQIPVTVYLVSDFLDGKLWLWVDRVKYAFLRSPARQFRTGLPDGLVLQFPLETADQRRAAAQEACEALKRQPNDTRLAVLESLPDLLKISIPDAPPPEYAPLAWEDVRQMSVGGVAAFGAHTRTHPVLSRISEDEECYREIDGSKRRIEEMLDQPVDHFCYPNGGPSDITPGCIEAVRRSRFRTAVTTRTGMNYASGDRFLLRRIGVEPGLDTLYFQQCAAAFRV
jgi:peptidoglycan/xylan/chitin deacetylase (PgdA/CDA1 family)